MLLQIKNLYFSYEPEKPLFQNFNLSIERGKIVAIAGESGCGKSTLLNIIYGLLDWESGEIFLEEKKLYGPKGNIVPGEKEIKHVAQNYDLMPYSTVYDNVGKYLSNINLAKKREKVMELLDVVGMREYADIKPQFLSGGQQQRVAIARALSVTPQLLLLDEPFSNLDFSRKITLREKLFSYVTQNNISLLISTHDIEEILPWLDEVVVIRSGRLIQKDSPKEIYHNPYDKYVANLLGEVNEITPELKEKWNLEKLFYYPSQIEVSTSGIPAKVLESRFSGSYYWNKIEASDQVFIVYTPEKTKGDIFLQFKS